MALHERFSKCMEMKTQTLDYCLTKSSADSPILQINGFHYDLEADQTLANSFEKCENVLRNDLGNIPDDIKVRLLLQTIGFTKNETFK